MSNATVSARRIGKVVEQLSFGAVVKFDDAQEGLLHATRMRGGSRVARNRRSERLVPGSSVEVDVTPDGRKLRLSERWHDDVVLAQLAVGATVAVEVARVLDSGMIVTILGGVAEGVDGYVHVTELAGEPRQRDRALAATREGARLELEVLSVCKDEQGDLRIRLSQRAATMRQKVSTTFAVGTTHTGRVVRRTERGYIVSFGDFSGILPDNELGKTNPGSIRSGSNTRTKVVGVGEDGILMLTRRGL